MSVTDALPLAPRPSLEQYRKRAKGLLAAARSDDPDAIRKWTGEWLAKLAQLQGLGTSPEVAELVRGATDRVADFARSTMAAAGAGTDGLGLADAQYVIAQLHGFESWATFAGHLRDLEHAAGGTFERAVDAIIAGDLAMLHGLLRAHPEQIRARSARLHHATLLHYVAANGVEDYRQITPANAVEVARTLLEAGAAVDALADTYGGGSLQTTMNLLVSSVHPAARGVQAALVETLLDHGAAINGLDDDASPIMTALVFGYPVAAETLARRGARVSDVVTAAGLGRDDLVRAFLAVDGTLRGGMPVRAAGWLRFPDDPQAVMERAMILAASLGRESVVELLSRQRVDLAAKDGQGFTALHAAAFHGHLGIVELLLARGAPLEVTNAYGGTVLDSTVWGALHSRSDFRDGVRTPIDHLPVIERLLEAGADVNAVDYPTDMKLLDEILVRYGARTGAQSGGSE